MKRKSPAHPERGSVPDRPQDRPTRGLIALLAGADLFHEKVLNTCLVLALTAVVAPLLILLGLKNGIVETMRDRLVEDPRNREIRPRTSRLFEQAWFEDLSKRPDVAFVAPMTRQIATGVTATVAGGDKPLDLDLLATGPGDVLLLENGAPIPGPRECVLSHGAAEKLGVIPGTEVEIEVGRFADGRRDTVTVTHRCVGITTPRATGLPAMFAPLSTLVGVEKYRDGHAVPEFGWPGGFPEAQPVFDGALLALAEPLDREDQLELIVATGFSKIRILPTESWPPCGLPELPDDCQLYLLTSTRSGVGHPELENLRKRVPFSLIPPIPWTPPRSITLVDPVSGTALGSVPVAIGASLQPAPENGPRIQLPASLATFTGDQVLVRTNESSRPLSFPAKVLPSDAPDEALALVDTRTGGILRLNRDREVRFLDDPGVFVVARRGYSGFRLYASSIDAVPKLEDHFLEMGIPVFTEAARIRDVSELDRYLRYIFWMIATVAILGGTAALVASLYASTERKRRPLGVMRLLGLTRLQLLCFPLYQALAIVALTMICAGSAYGLVAHILNRYSAPLLGQEAQICRLPLNYLPAGLLLAVALAATASLLAATRIARIEPAEALRDE